MSQTTSRSANSRSANSRSANSARTNRRGRSGAADGGPRAKFSQLLPYLFEHKGVLSVVIVLSILGAAASLAQPGQQGLHRLIHGRRAAARHTGDVDGTGPGMYVVS